MSRAAAPLATVASYLAGLPADRRPAIAKVRDVVRQHLPPGFEEGIQYGMISWFVPPERHGHSYNAQPLTIAALASQKSYMALYLTGLYADPAVAKWFTAAYRAAGKKLDMGKSCIRFHRLDDLPLDVVAQAAARITVDDYVAAYEKAQAGRKQKPIVLAGRTPAAAAQAAPRKASGASKQPTSKASKKSPASKPSPASKASKKNPARKASPPSKSSPARRTAAKPTPLAATKRTPKRTAKKR